MHPGPSRHALLLLAVALVAPSAIGCGSSGDDDVDPALDAATSDGMQHPLDDASPSDASRLDATADTSSSPDARPDAPDGADATAPDASAPCTTVVAAVAACEALIGTVDPASASVEACIHEMPVVQASAAASCLGDGGVVGFDSTVLEVVTSALARTTPTTCDATSMAAPIQWMADFVATARSLSTPPFAVDHAVLVQLDDAFWQGVYSGLPQASTLDRTSLRTLRADALDCAKGALDAVYTPVSDPDASAPTYPLTTAPLVGITSEALSALVEGYDRTTVGYEARLPLPDVRRTRSARGKRDVERARRPR